MEGLRRRNVGTALNYNAEADSNELEAKKGGAGAGKTSPVDLELARYQEIESALGIQGDFEDRMYREGWAKGSSAFALKIVSCITDSRVINNLDFC